jgi:hypothetical protein
MDDHRSGAPGKGWRTGASAVASPQLAQPTGVSAAVELLVIGTSSDDPVSRLGAGEAMSAVLSTPTAVGLAAR